MALSFTMDLTPLLLILAAALRPGAFSRLHRSCTPAAPSLP
jgi:hypothetical protein